MTELPHNRGWIGRLQSAFMQSIEKFDLKKKYTEFEYEKFHEALQESIAGTLKNIGDYSLFGMKVGPYLTVFPYLFYLGYKMLFDRSIPVKNKSALVAGLAYVIWPLDFIPDPIPIAGWVDDVMVLAVALNSLLEDSDPLIKKALKKYWKGEDDVLKIIKEILDILEEALYFLPKKFIKLIKDVFPKGYSK